MMRDRQLRTISWVSEKTLGVVLEARVELATGTPSEESKTYICVCLIHHGGYYFIIRSIHKSTVKFTLTATKGVCVLILDKRRAPF